MPCICHCNLAKKAGDCRPDGQAQPMHRGYGTILGGLLRDRPIDAKDEAKIDANWWLYVNPTPTVTR